MRTSIATVLVALAAGCSGPPRTPERPERPVTESALTVVVWSDELQRPVPARGHLRPLGGGDVLTLDTRRTPERGQTFRGLPPGQYQVEVRLRYLRGEETQRVEGAHTIYLEPGVAPSVTVVAIDRGELGLRNEAVPASTSDDRG